MFDRALVWLPVAIRVASVFEARHQAGISLLGLNLRRRDAVAMTVIVVLVVARRQRPAAPADMALHLAGGKARARGRFVALLTLCGARHPGFVFAVHFC